MIEHQGIITSISDKKISVKIIQQSACSTCHAKGACMAADSKEKVVEVTDVTGKYLEVGRNGSRYRFHPCIGALLPGTLFFTS